MATVSTDLTWISNGSGSFSDCDSDTWDGGIGTLETDTQIQGSGCLSFKQTGAGLAAGPAMYTAGSAINMAGKNLYGWVSGLKISQWDSKTNGGIRFRMDDGTNWIEFFVAGGNTIPNQGWVCHCARGADTVDGALQHITPSTYNDETTAANNNTANDMTLMRTAGQGTPTVGDGYLFGKSMPFLRVIVRVSTAGVGSWTYTWKYWNGSDWTALSGVTDRTTGFTVSGVNRVEYTLPTDWKPATFGSLGPYYWIKAELTAYTSATTRPLGQRAFVRFGVDPQRSDVSGTPNSDINNNYEIDYGQVTKMGWRWKLLVGAAKTNIWWDSFMHGTGMTVSDSDASFQNFLDYEATYAYGVVSASQGVINVQGRLNIGVEFATTVFSDTDKHIRFRSSDVGDHVFGIAIQANSLNPVSVTFGQNTVVAGKNLTSGGLLIDTNGPKFLFTVTWGNNTGDAFNFYGTKFKGASRIDLGTPSATCPYVKMINCKFEGCNRLTINDGGYSTYDQNSVASALTTPLLNACELYALTGTSTWTDNTFINCNSSGQRALVFAASGTKALKRTTFANNTYDLYFDHPSGTVTVDLVDSTDNPVIRPTASNSLSYNIYERTTWNLNLKNESGTGLTGASVRLTDTGGTEQVLVQTTGGDIAEQQVKRRTSEHSSGLPKGAPTVTVHNPYNLRFRKYDYMPEEIGGKTFSTVAVTDAFVMTDDDYASTAEGTVATWTNITIDETHSPDRIELGSASPDRSITQVYERMRYLTAQTANMDLPDPITTADGVGFQIVDYDFEVNTVVLTGAGKTLYMPTKDFILSNGGSHTLDRVQDIDGVSVTFSLIDLQADSEVRIYRVSDDTLLAGTESSGATFPYNYTWTEDIPVYYIVFHLEWLPIHRTATLTNQSQAIPIVQIEDRTFENP